MRNHEAYTKNIYQHVPDRYFLNAAEINYILDNYDYDADKVGEGWKLGFMMAYHAAKRGKLDFQRGQK